MGGWHATEAGWRVLRGTDTVTLRKPTSRAARGPAPRPVPGAAPADDELFEALRTTRTALARARGVPAYVIFHDATLIEIAARKPATLDELAACQGVGAKKLQRYGRAFLDVVAGREAPRPHPAEARLAGGPGAGLIARLRAAEASLARGACGTLRPLSCGTPLLARIAERRPASLAALAAIRGMDDARLDRFGAAFLAAIAEE